MNPSGISGPSDNWLVGFFQIDGVAPATANTQPSLHARSLTLAFLSQHSFEVLNDKVSQGSESDKQLASLVKNLMQSDSLLISRNHQQTGITGIVQYGREQNNNILVVQARMNSHSEYDILAVAFRGAFEEPVRMRFPEPRDEAAGIARSQPPLLSLPNELLQQIAEPPQFTPLPPMASTQPSTVNPVADFARLHSPHPGPFRLSGDDKPDSAERNQRLRSALLCGWDSLRRLDPKLVGGLLNYYQASVSLSQGEFGILAATFAPPQGLYLTTLGYRGTETNWEHETGVVLPEQASPPPRGELTWSAQQPGSLSPLLTEEPSTGSKGKKRAVRYSLEPPSTRPGFQPTQLGGTQIQGIPLVRKRALEQLVDETIIYAQQNKIGKNSAAVNKRFEKGVAAMNAQPGKTPIDRQAAAAFYANASVGTKRLPKALVEKLSEDRKKLAKIRYGPDATATDYDRANREKLAKLRYGPDATATDYTRETRKKLAKVKLGPDATPSNYDRAMKAVQAVRELGPTAKVADFVKLQAEEIALARQQGVGVEVIRSARKQRLASGKPSSPGTNQ